MNAFQGMDAAGVAAYAHYLDSINAEAGPSPAMRLYRHIATLVQRYRRYRRAAKALGAAPEIPLSRIDEILAEASAHRWIEAEKAGSDIWVAADPADPEGAALRDWFAKHYQAWRAARLQKPAGQATATA
jgi:hypothetical protein